MPTLFGLARIGRDCEVRFTPSGEAVANISLAFNYGKKGDDGYRPTQWVDASMWGKRAEALAPYLLKGKAVAVTLDEVHIETYNSRDGTPGSKLVGRVAQIELAGGGEAGGERQARPAAPAQSGYADAKEGKAPKTNTGTGFDDMDDDIPFIVSANDYELMPSKMRRLRRARY